MLGLRSNRLLSSPASSYTVNKSIPKEMMYFGWQLGDYSVQCTFISITSFKPPMMEAKIIHFIEEGRGLERLTDFHKLAPLLITK